MADKDEMLVGGIITLLGKSIDAEMSVRMESERQFGMTERVRAAEQAKTERFRIAQEAELMHHMIDARERYYSKELEADYQLKLRTLDLLDRQLNNTNEVNEPLRDVCLSLINVLNSDGSNIGRIEEKRHIYNKLLEMKKQF